jgi:putative transcriptional regulator
MDIKRTQVLHPNLETAHLPDNHHIMTDREHDWRNAGNRSFLAGRVLISMPGIEDERFSRPIIYLCVHTPDQAMGVTLNHPAEGLTLSDILTSLDLEPPQFAAPDPVLIGGPVERERGFVLHTDDYLCERSTLTVAGGVAMTATKEVLQAISQGQSGPRKAILALGYAGWGPGQLEQEIRDNIWLTCEADEDLLFDPNPVDKWSKALAKIGVNAGKLSAQSGRA